MYMPQSDSHVYFCLLLCSAYRNFLFSFILVFCFTRNLKIWVNSTCTYRLCHHMGFKMCYFVCMFLLFPLNVSFVSIIVTRKLHLWMGIEKCYVGYAPVSFSVNFKYPTAIFTRVLRPQMGGVTHCSYCTYMPLFYVLTIASISFVLLSLTQTCYGILA